MIVGPSGQARARVTGFVSHYDCSRHDTGWGSPDHQGRLPGIMRAVHAEMLTLFGSLKQIEGRHASERELLLGHAPGYLAQVRAWVEGAAMAGEPVEIRPGLMASSATWEASVAAVGTTLQGIDAVLTGEVKNAFCAVRPPAADAEPDGPGRLGFLNQLAVGTRSLLDRDVSRVLLVEWQRRGVSASANVFAEAGRVRRVGIDLSSAGSARSGARPDGEEASPARAVARSTDEVLEHVAREFRPEFILLSADFDQLAAGTEDPGGIGPAAFHASTLRIRDFADAECGGRLVSVLEGGASPRLGAAVVDHVRALAGIEASAG